MENKKMTAPNVSVGADTEQSPNVCTDSITDLEQDFKEIEEMQKEMFRQMQPSYLKTVSMADLYETDFEIICFIEEHICLSALRKWVKVL